MMDRDDWLSPAAFVAGIDLGGETAGAAATQIEKNALFRPVTLVNASYQTGCCLTIDPLVEPLDAGQILTIDGVFQWDRRDDRIADGHLLCQFVITKSAEVGDTLLCLYPPIIGAGDKTYRTVVDLPMNRSGVRKVLPKNAG